MSYYTKITRAGLSAITSAMANNTKVPITYMAFGDGHGVVPEPDENSSSLINEVFRVGVNKVEKHAKNDNWLVCEAIIPSAVGGFNIREVALFDNTGTTMLAVASYPPTYKPSIEEGAAKIQTIRIVLQVDNVGNFELVIDPDVVLATVEYVNQELEKKKFSVDSLPDLMRLTPPDGTYAYLTSYHGGWAVENPYIGPRGGGDFVYDSGKKNTNNGITIFNGWTRIDVKQITPEMAGAFGTGNVSDADVIQKCINYGRTTKSVLYCDRKYLIDKQITGDAVSGISSNNRGTFIISADITAFKFQGIEASKWFERINFEFTVPTVLNNAAVEFDFRYLVIGLKFRDNSFNSQAGHGWTGLRVKGSNNSGFFGAFEFSNIRSHNMYIDLHFADGAYWSNSGVIQNNFKFYGTYGVLVDTNANINNMIFKNYQGQECSGNTIRVNGGMHKCSMELIYNWDTFNPAIYLGTRASSNIISLTYIHDIVDYGFANEIDNRNIMLATDTAIASDIFEEVARSSEASFRQLFNHLKISGNAQKAEGTHNELGSGRGRSGLMVYVAPAIPLKEGQTATEVNENGYFLLDNHNIQVSGTIDKFYGKYDRYSTLRMQVDFEILSNVIDDNALTIGIGAGANNNSKPTRYFGLTVQNGELCIVQQTSDSSRTVLAKMGPPTKRRYILQLRSGNRQSIGIQAVYLNGVKVAEVSLDVDGAKRPFIEAKANNNPLLINLLGCKLRNWIYQGIQTVSPISMV